MNFDAYETWLGIPADRRPPTLYDLLGLAPFESNSTTIDQAALRRMGRVRQHQIGPHSDQSQEILSELARARLILLDPDRRAVYDAKLRKTNAEPLAPVSDFPFIPPTGDANRNRSVSSEKAPHASGSLAFSALTTDTPSIIEHERRQGLSWWRKWIIIGAIAASHVGLLGAFLYFVFGPPRSQVKPPSPPPVQAAASAPTVKGEPKRQATLNRSARTGRVRSPTDELHNAALAGQRYTRGAKAAPGGDGKPDGGRTADPWRPEMQIARANAADAGEETGGKENGGEEQGEKEPTRVAKEEKTPQAILAKHDLKLEGTTYILDSEFNMLAAWRKQERSRWELARAQMFQQGARTPEERLRMIQEAEAAISDLSFQISEFNRQLGEIDRQPWGRLANSMVDSARRQIEATRSQCERDRQQMQNALNSFNRQIFNPAERERADHQVREAEESLEEAVAEFDKQLARRESPQKVKQKYAELRKNKDITGAIEELNKRSRVHFKLGPIPELSKLGRIGAKSQSKTSGRAHKETKETSEKKIPGNE